MAINRMYLVYRPTGDAVFLGERGSFGWYGVPEDLPESIAALFSKVETSVLDGNSVSQDDFAVALEVGDKQPHALTKWNFDRNHKNTGSLSHLLIAEDVPYGEKEKI